MSFDFNVFVGILGIILTIIFGILSIYLVKRKQYPGAITYIEDQSTGLFKSLVKNFSDIDITYKQKNISQQIALVKGFLINTGTNDINVNMIEQDLAINLPDNFKWLSAKIVDQSVGNKSSINIINDKSIIVNLELFRKNEFISFEALAEVPINDKDTDAGQILSDNIIFNHRISDTAKVKKQNLNLADDRFWNLKYLFRRLLLIVLGAINLILMILVTNLKSQDRVIMYSINNVNTHKQIKVYADAKFDNSIKLIDEQGDVYKISNIKQFHKNDILDLSIGLHPHSGFISKNLDTIMITVMSIFFIVTFIPFIGSYIEYKKVINLKKTLNLIE